MSRVSRTKSTPAPVGGWNARDPIADMPPNDAVTLDNFFPQYGYVQLRLGSESHATGMTGNVETLMTYQTPTASKLFAAVGTTDLSIFDVTSAGAVGAAEVSSLTNARFHYVNFGVSGTYYLYAVNGEDKPLLYNGSAWVSIDGASTPAVSGVTTTSLDYIAIHVRRVWFIEKSSLKAWYLPVDSVGGAASSFDFSSVFRRGGYLVAMGSWTIDAGEGMDDHAVFVTSKGEVAVYKGTDPSSSTTWALIGVFTIGEPIGRKCLAKYGGDLSIITVDGVMPLSKVILTDRGQPTLALTDKIRAAFANRAASYKAAYGWQSALYPEASMMVVNIPSGDGEQFAMNTQTGAWGRFTGWEAYSFATRNGELYYGGTDAVYQAWSTYADAGSNITGTARQADSKHGFDGVKRYTMARPIILTTGSPGIKLGVNTDYKTDAPIGTPTYTASTGAVFGTAVFGVDVFGGGERIFNTWQSVRGLGYTGAPHIKVVSKAEQVKWVATDLVFEPGHGL